MTQLENCRKNAGRSLQRGFGSHGFLEGGLGPSKLLEHHEDGLLQLHGCDEGRSLALSGSAELRSHARASRVPWPHHAAPNSRTGQMPSVQSVSNRITFYTINPRHDACKKARESQYRSKVLARGPRSGGMLCRAWLG